MEGEHEPMREQGESMPIFFEIAARELSLNRLYLQGRVEEWVDSVIRRLPDGLNGFKRILEDDQVYAAWQQRRLALVDREVDVRPGGTDKASEMAADWLKEQVEHLDLPSIIEDAHYGIFYGFSVAEMMYARDGRHIAIDNILVRDRTRFRITHDWNLRLIDTEEGQDPGMEIPENKMWVFQSGGTHGDESYGTGVAHYLYWLVLFRRGVIRDWLSYLERFAGPTAIGKYPPGAPPEDIKRLVESLLAFRSDSAIALPEDMNIDTIQNNSTAATDYGAPYDRFTDAISKVILSGTMTMEDGSSLSQAQVHADVAESVQRADARRIYGSLSRPSPYGPAPLQWHTAWNFPGAKVPHLFAVFETEEDINKVAVRDELLSRIGIRPDQEKVDKTYGPGYKISDIGNVYAQTSPAQQQPETAGMLDDPSFAETDPEAWAEVLQDGSMESALSDVQKTVNKARSFKSMLKRLTLRFARTESFGERLLTGILASNLAGRADAVDELEGNAGPEA